MHASRTTRAAAAATLLAALTLAPTALTGQAPPGRPPRDTAAAPGAARVQATQLDTVWLDTVRVSVASRTSGLGASAGRSVDVVDRAAIERTAARTLADVLALAVGADVLWRSPAQADLALRGGSYEQVLVLVDGVRVKDAQSGHFSLDLAVPLALVERVEVLRGAGSALYGPDAVGGVVNVVTRRDTNWRGARLRAGSFGTSGGAVGGGAARGGVALTAAVDHDRSSGHRVGTDYRATQARLGVRRAGRLGSLQADAGVGARAFGAADFYAPFPSFETTRTATGAVRWDVPVARGWRVTSTLATRRHADDYILKRADPAFYRNEHLAWQTSGDVVARWAGDARPLAVAVGAEAVDARLASVRLGDRRDLRSAAFAEATLGGPGTATLNGGLRYDQAPSYGGGFVSPTLAASVPVGRALRLRSSAARGFRAPTWTERYYRDPGNIGSPTLRPETFWSGEFGLRALAAQERPGMQLDLVGFVRQAEDLIDWARPAEAPPTTPWRTRNLGSARYRGAEARVDLPAVLGASWVLRASALAFDAGAAEGLVGKYALRPVTQTLGASATVPAGRRVRLALDATHARRTGERGYVAANARASGSWRGVELTVDALNLGGASWLDASAQPAPGRAVYVGMGWSGSDR